MSGRSGWPGDTDWGYRCCDVEFDPADARRFGGWLDPVGDDRAAIRGWRGGGRAGSVRVVELVVHPYGDYHGFRTRQPKLLGVVVGEFQQRRAKPAGHADDEVLRELLCATDVV